MRCLGGGCQRGRAPQPLAAFHPRTAHVTAPCCWGHDRSCGAATGPHRLIRQAMMHPLRRCSACMYVHTCACTYIHTSIGQYTVHASARKEGAHRQKREHRIEEAGGHPKGPWAHGGMHNLDTKRRYMHKEKDTAQGQGGYFLCHASPTCRLCPFAQWAITSQLELDDDAHSWQAGGVG